MMPWQTPGIIYRVAELLHATVSVCVCGVICIAESCIHFIAVTSQQPFGFSSETVQVKCYNMQQ